MTRIFWADVSPLLDDVIFDTAKSKLPPHRLQKLQKQKFRQDKNLTLASWLVLMEALKGFPSYDGNENITFQKGGKPVFYGNPNVHFNLSHSGQIAICAVSACPVGVDVQLISDFKEEICHRYFAPGEADFVLNEKDPLKRKNNFFKVWALKEAYAKMTGGGLGEFKKFEIDLSGGINVKSIHGAHDVTFNEFDISGYKAALCVGGAETDFDFKRINLTKLLIN